MLALLLVLGLATSLLVAWAGALVDRDGWPDTPLTSNPTGARTEMRGWLVEQGRDRTLTWRTFDALDLWDGPPDLESPTELPAWSVGRDLPDQPGPFVPARERTRDVAWDVSAGWPMRCVRATRGAGPEEFALPGEFVRGGVAAMAVEWPISHDAIAEADRPGVDAWPAGGLAAVVPVRPMLGGLVVNTIVFALAWGVALSPLVALRVLRRWRRRKKDRCVRCGHSVQGLPDGAPCTECGRSLQHRTTIAELLTARAPMLGASLALVLVISASAGLLMHRWMAVDRLPPLHHAAAVGDVERIERLLVGGADIEGQFIPMVGSHEAVEFSTALHWAAARGHAHVVATLLDAGASPWGYSPFDAPLHEAMLGRHEDIVERLLPFSHGGGNSWPEVEFISRTSLSIAERVLDGEPRSQRDLYDAATFAVRAGDIALFDLLLRTGLSLDSWESTSLLQMAIDTDALAWAWEPSHDLGMTRALVERHAEPMRAVHDYEVARAIRGGCLPCLDALLEFGAVPEAYTMYEAVREEEPAILQRLIDAGAPVEAPDESGRSVLWYAACLLNADLVRILLDAGADPAQEVDGLTVRTVLANGQDVDLGTFRRVSSEHRAARPSEVRRICDLLEAAEAQWDARGESPQDAAAPDGG